MKKRGFDTQGIVERLREKGLDIKPPTLAKYLGEFRRQKDKQKAKRQDTPPPRPITAKAIAIAQRAARMEERNSSLYRAGHPLGRTVKRVKRE